MSRLYLITPPLSDGDAFAPLMSQACESGDVACVLVRFAEGADAKRVVAPLLEIAAAHDAALLIEGDPRDAARLGVDGVHVDFADVAEAVASFKSQCIVGAGGLRLRDDAMSAAEAGADYVWFGEPGDEPAATLERVEWWAEIFETPCVGYAARIEEVAALAAAGADFVALDSVLWSADAGAMAAVMQALGA